MFHMKHRATASPLCARKTNFGRKTGIIIGCCCVTAHKIRIYLEINATSTINRDMDNCLQEKGCLHSTEPAR